MERVSSRTLLNATDINVESVGSVDLVNEEKVIQYIIHDIKERRRSEEKLKYPSNHDELAGPNNQVSSNEEICHPSADWQFPLTLMFAHVDGLNQINDCLGRAAADEQLRKAASVLKETFRADDVVARIGGDEFVVVLLKADATTAEKALDRARNHLRSYNEARSGPFLSLSLGAATVKPSQAIAVALKQAHENMEAERVPLEPPGQSPIQHDLQWAFKHIDARLSASPGTHLSVLASELGCERHLIEQAIRVVKSMQFREFQQIKRMETALHLLAQRHLLLKEIADKLGYSSAASLWRLLKTRMKRSPSSIRAQKNKTSTADTANMDYDFTSKKPVQLELKLPASGQ